MMADFAPSYSSFVKGLKCLSFPTFLPLGASCLRASKAKIKQGEANGSTIWSLKREREVEEVDFQLISIGSFAVPEQLYQQPTGNDSQGV